MAKPETYSEWFAASRLLHADLRLPYYRKGTN
jgi:hypothetical protein